MASRLKKFGIDNEALPIVLNIDMRRSYNKFLCDLKFEGWLKFISNNLIDDSHLYISCINHTDHYHFSNIDEDVVCCDPGFYLNVIKGKYKYRLIFTDFPSNMLNKQPKKKCVIL
jgi:hypothetical protein